MGQKLCCRIWPFVTDKRKSVPLISRSCEVLMTVKLVWKTSLLLISESRHEVLRRGSGRGASREGRRALIQWDCRQFYTWGFDGDPT
jgi:hypothetical protein